MSQIIRRSRLETGGNNPRQSVATNNNNRDCTNNNNRGNGSAGARTPQNRRKVRASDNVKWQAFWYVGSFFLTWVFLTIVRGMQTAGAKGGDIPYWLKLAGVTLCPSQ